MPKSELYNIKSDSLTDSSYEMNTDEGFCKKNISKNKNRFKNKIAVVTGSTGDFGKLCVEKLAEEGCNVYLWDLMPDHKFLSSLQDKYPEQTFETHKLDICNENKVKENTQNIISKSEKIDLLFNNAGYQGDFKNTLDYSLEDFRKTIDINVVGAFVVLKEISMAMKSQHPQGGSIVNTASMAGIGAPPNMIAYATSKAAIKHMTVVASKDLSPYNIRINSISPAFIGPGFMWTRQVELQAKANSIYFSDDPENVAKEMINEVPMKRYGTIDEVIDPVLFLLSDESSYITGTDIKITGGI